MRLALLFGERGLRAISSSGSQADDANSCQGYLSVRPAGFLGEGQQQDQAEHANTSESWIRRNPLHDLVIALAFIGMVFAPAIVATNSRVEVEDDWEQQVVRKT
jgi:hypothetical protein